MTDVSIEPNTYVTLDYVLHDEAGDVLDDSNAEDGEPIEYVHGYGMLVPGLESRLVGLKVGDARKIVVPAEEAFGERDPELVLDVERSEFPEPDQIEIGDEFVAESPDGDEAVMRVVEIKEDSVTCDANHPLAGITLHYDIKVREVRPATEDEIQAAAEDLDDAAGEAGHVHDESCGHDHGHSHGDGLVSLGKSKKES
jgi:FKBP-type peptidyl-prolyl cis-trans isomerase SlyD